MTSLRVGRHATLRPGGEPRRALAAHAGAARKAGLHPVPVAIRIGGHLRLAHRLPVLGRAIHV
jgi:hypothetical protein